MAPAAILGIKRVVEREAPDASLDHPVTNRIKPDEISPPDS